MNGSQRTGVQLRGEPMSRHTSWRVGGPADIFFKPASIDELQSFLRDLAPGTPVHWIGLGSNLLVRDGGIRGAVISTAAFMKHIDRLDQRRVRAGAGVPCPILARQCVRWQLGPSEFLAGIPGTLGGALAMNAGAFGGETWECVESAETIDRHGIRRNRNRTEFTVGYRTVVGPPGEWFLSAVLRFAPDRRLQMSSIKAVLEQRGASQPLGQPSCGSVFRNPPGHFAGRLVEEAGFKGAEIGGARVSDKHANFIINTGTATAADIEQLIELVRAGVRARTGIELELEVRIIGEQAAGP
jgi:UDP-N-acetylmuramate dehydrogenase